jgi:hypothetical protein
MALTRTQPKNLAKLADYLEDLPEGYEHFGMSDYLQTDNRDAEIEYAKRNGGVAHCGTAACAIGHGPAAGLLFKPSEFQLGSRLQPVPDWGAYARRFVAEEFDRNYNWAFGGGWAAYDNHHWGAAARIRYLLAYGSPPAEFFTEGDCRDAYHEFDKRFAEQAAS